ncbi:MAG: beta-ketoacyl-[acyl-carrier-protein] synthase family protein [Candidatus Omnitrophica bacterium]|nr:beta-ketoacyl-[acyl-carrier-protein] synthase family protein [Candidatus Omnitrophota bacterium]
MPSDSIAITGLGAISACGNNTDETLHNFSKGARSAGKVSLFKTELDYPVFEVKGFSQENKFMMRTIVLSFCAVKEALQEARLEGKLGDFRVGICLGTTVASQLNDTDFYSAYRDKGSAPMDSVNRYLKSNLAGCIAEFLNLRPKLCATIVNACSSGTDAIGAGLSWLRNNYCDIVIAGGADELNRVPYDGFSALSVMSKTLCAPFDRDRLGLNLGEGSGVVILERASLRGKNNFKLNLCGYGLAADAYHLTAPRPDGSGLENALSQALNEANIYVKDVDFINAHGTATHDNDLVEGSVLARVFGSKIKFLSTKGFTGHTLGGAGGLEAVFTCLGLREGWVPNSAGFENIDEKIGIAPVKERTRVSGKYAISTSLAFGGNNSALVFSRN